ESEPLKKAAADWEGAMRCIIEADDDQAFQDYTTEDGVKAILGMLSLLSPEERLKYKDTGLGQLAEKLGLSLDMDPEAIDATSLKDKVKQLTREDFQGVTIYASFQPYRGTIREMDPIAPDSYLDAPFTLSGKYTFWKILCTGQQTSVQLIMGGKMKLEGDLKYIMKRMAAVNALMEVFKSIPVK
ncbi:MAG TPA: SCP2 sterol-binding domain-containing protein, partial [Bacillota bacterium]|nr:SCP2 sterol-binding domain-containing protein [Bacillota bacterium]